jgi:tripartite-type tricarboxylate transporter receptor subunit TctC
MMARTCSLPIAAALLVLATAPALPQDYPSRTVTVIAPSAPGGMYSLFARLIAIKLEQRFGKSFIVENRPGAASVIGITQVVRSAPDGHTLVVVNNTGMAVNPALHRSLSYDPLNDLVPIGLIVRIPEVLVVHAALPVQSLAELGALAKSTPGGLSYASAGPGTQQHLGAVLLQSVLGVSMTHVPYKGMSPAINDVAAGHVPFMFSPVPFAIPLAQAGKLRMLGVTTAERVPAIPEVPTLAAMGAKEFSAVSWFMLAAPAKTPQPIVDRLHAELRLITDSADVQQEFIRLGLLPIASPPAQAELRPFIQSEMARWGEIVRRAGLAGTQ